MRALLTVGAESLCLKCRQIEIASAEVVVVVVSTTGLVGWLVEGVMMRFVFCSYLM